MKYRLLGRSGLKVSVMTMGTMTFTHARESPVGAVGLEEARRQIDLCLDHGVNMLDTANFYSFGESEDIIGQALGAKRQDVLLATKARLPMGKGPNESGNSRLHLIASCEASLRRLRTDHVDLFLLHQWDGETPLEETLSALDALVASGKVRYVGCSNFSGWHIMKALGVSERLGLERFVAQQIHYTLQAREAEYELVPISLVRGPRDHGLEPDRRRSAQRQVPPGPGRTGGRAPHARPQRSADPRRGRALRDHRCDHGDRGRPGCFRRPGGPRLAARPARDRDRRDRGPQRRPVPRQPRRRRPRAHRGRAPKARCGERASRCSIRTGIS